MASILLPQDEPCFRAGRARCARDFDAAYFVWVTRFLHFHGHPRNRRVLRVQADLKNAPGKNFPFAMR